MPTKSIFSSVTFWGSVMGLLAMFVPKIFVALGQDAPTTAANIVAIIGFVTAVIGRWRASTQVSLTGK